MKQFARNVFIILFLFGCSVSYARDTLHQISLEEAMSSADSQAALTGEVQFFFGDQDYPEVERQLGTYTSNKKTNAFGKSDQEACKWAFLSAMISLQQRAIAEGGDAVVNIRSNYKRHGFTSATDFECGAGAIMAGVTMVGDVVKLAE